MKDFEFQMRENVRAIEDRAAQQKLSKEAERRIQRLRREFQESFNQTVVAHRTGADQGDANAQPHVLRHIAAGDRVLLKSMGKVGDGAARGGEGSVRSGAGADQDAGEAR